MNFDLNVNDPSQKQTVYIPHDEHNLVKEIYLLSVEGLRFIKFFENLLFNQRFFGQYYSRANIDWYGHTLHAYYAMTISYWCMIFGSHKSEPSHYYKLINKKIFSNALNKVGLNTTTINTFEESFSKKIEIEKCYFESFRYSTLHLRNKFFTHKEWIENMGLIKNRYFPDINNIPKKSFSGLLLLFNEASYHLPKTPQNDYSEIEFYVTTDKNDIDHIITLNPDINWENALSNLSC